MLTWHTATSHVDCFSLFLPLRKPLKKIRLKKTVRKITFSLKKWRVSITPPLLILIRIFLKLDFRMSGRFYANIWEYRSNTLLEAADLDFVDSWKATHGMGPCKFCTVGQPTILGPRHVTCALPLLLRQSTDIMATLNRSLRTLTPGASEWWSNVRLVRKQSGCMFRDMRKLKRREPSDGGRPSSETSRILRAVTDLHIRLGHIAKRKNHEHPTQSRTLMASRLRIIRESAQILIALLRLYVGADH